MTTMSGDHGAPVVPAAELVNWRGNQIALG